MGIYTHIATEASPASSGASRNRNRSQPDFASKMTAEVFGKNYTRFSDRDFRDRLPPSWRQIGDVAAAVLDEVDRRRNGRAA